MRENSQKSGRILTAFALATSLALFGLLPDAQAATPGQDIQPITHGGFVLKTADGSFTFKLGGVIQADGAVFNQDKTDLGSGADIHYARLAASGTVYHDWAYKAQFDFASSNEVKNLYIRYTGFDPAAITLGHFKQPFSLQNATSLKYITFMERSLFYGALTPGRRLGVAVSGHADTGGRAWTFAGGVFGNKLGKNRKEDAGVGFTGRVTYSPVHTRSRLLHVGASMEVRDAGDDNTLKFASRPESFLADPLVGVKVTDVHSIWKLGVEAAAVQGPFSVQAEYVTTRLRRHGADPAFQGWYVQGGWVITGESRAASYSAGKAAFGQIVPQERYGAWQLAVRYDELDLNSSGFVGGHQKNLTVGLNWFPVKLVRFSANYVKVLKLSRPGDKHDGDEPGIYQLQAQLYF